MVAPARPPPSGPITPSDSASAYPLIVVSGVRSSCEMDSRKSRCRPSLVVERRGQVVERVRQLLDLGRRLRPQPHRAVAGRQPGRGGRRGVADRPGQPPGQQGAGQHAGDQAGEQGEPQPAAAPTIRYRWRRFSVSTTPLPVRRAAAAPR